MADTQDNLPQADDRDRKDKNMENRKPDPSGENEKQSSESSVSEGSNAPGTDPDSPKKDDIHTGTEVDPALAETEKQKEIADIKENIPQAPVEPDAIQNTDETVPPSMAEEEKQTDPKNIGEEPHHEATSSVDAITKSDPSGESAKENLTDDAIPAAKAENIRQEELEEMTDEELEGDDDHEEVNSDDDEHDEFAHHELELPDYSHHAPEKLVEEAEKLLRNEPVQKLKDHFDSIRKNLLSYLNEEKKEKLAEFLEAGGVEMDFEYIQPLRVQFKKIFSEYRSKRQAYYKDLDDRLQNNLQIKNELIEKLKELVTRDESIGDTFREFNNLQQEWRNTGPVPRNESGDLWRTYHHHVENFYEFIKINKELRDLDFKKNHETKEQLIAEVEALSEKEDIREAFAELQKLHKKWKRIGPVEREFREPMWQRFSAATKKLHDRREEYFEELKGQREELIEKKKKLVQQLDEFPFEKIKSHSKWQQAIKAVEALREEFRKIGRINHPENDLIWEKLRGVLKDFNHSKNQFYKDLKKEQYDNLNKKKELLQIAESLKESDDWRYATNELKRIQAKWKQIGHVPRAESDKIWKLFRAACNYYFDRLTAHNKELDKEFIQNYEQKELLMKELSEFEPAENQKDSVKALKDVINRWKAIGKVPRDKSKIENDFNKLLDNKFKAIDMDRQESQRIRFENKMSSMVDQGGDQQLTKERSFLRGKLDEAKRELSQLETNMSFFSSSNPKSPFIIEAGKKIEHQKQSITELEDKIKMLNIKIRQVNKPDEVEEKPETDTETTDQE